MGKIKLERLVNKCPLFPKKLFNQDNSFNILDSSGDYIGVLKISICTKELRLPINLIDSSIVFYTDQIANFSWPVAFLDRIEVTKRNNGYGTQVLEMFYSIARQHGAYLCMLMIGWNKTGDVKANQLWYENRGWKLLDDPPNSEVSLYLMYKQL